MAINNGHGEPVQLHKPTPGPPNSHRKPTATFVDSEVSGVDVADPVAYERSDATVVSRGRI